MELSQDMELVIESSKSTRVSLAGIRIGRFEHNEHRTNLLVRVPKPGDYATFGYDSLEMMELAYLSAKTGDEFAILRGRQEDVLFHGNPTECKFVGELEEGLKAHVYI